VISFLYALPSIILVGVANVLLKWRIDYLSSQHITVASKSGIKILLDPYVLIGAGATGVSILWWLNIMSRVKVSAVYPMIQAGAIVTTLILSHAFLHERLSLSQIIGISILVSGIIVTSSGA
jgi:drug/metabolite transporter (DMT)-like permease